MHRGALASWMHHFSTTCPDPGLKAFQVLPESEIRFPRIAIWIGLLIAAEQATHAVVLAVTARRPLKIFNTRTKPYELPVGLALIWVIFTALSIFLVAMTFRSNAAILAKSLHVAAEAGLLILISAAFGFHVFSGMVALLVIIVLLLVFTLNCEDTVAFAASSGLILDAANFLVYAWFGFSRPNDRILWLLIGGLGWHGMYLLTQLEVMRWTFLETIVKLWCRIFGLYFNLIADEFVLSACRHALIDTRFGTLDLKEWVAAKDETDTTPYCLWTSRGLRLLGPVPEGADCRVYAFEPHRTAYTPAVFYYAVNAYWPMVGEVRYRREGRSTLVREAVCCAFGWMRPRAIVDINSIPVERAYVLSWNQVRGAYWICLIIAGVILGNYP